MAQHTWFITGVSNGFGRELTRQLLERGLTTLHSVDGDALERDSPACRSDPTEVALVCSKQSPPHHHPVTFRNQIIDFVSSVR